MSNSAIAVIGETQISILFFNAQPVITLAMMDQVHGRPEGTARRNFNEHKDKLIADKDYFVRSKNRIRHHRAEGFNHPHRNRLPVVGQILRRRFSLASAAPIS